MRFSQDFFEKSILLLVTALLTGLLVPYLLKKIDGRKLRAQKESDERKFREQKVFEAELARQNKIIEAQSKFLDDISQMLWKWRYMCVKVAYYGSDLNQEKYLLARKEFDDNIWSLFQSMRSEISRSRRLISDNAYRRLLTLYHDMLSIDEELSELIKIERLDESASKKYLKLNNKIHSLVSGQVDESLNSIAAELRLKGSIDLTSGPPNTKLTLDPAEHQSANQS